MYIIAHTIEELLKTFYERVKSILINSVAANENHLFHESAHFEVTDLKSPIKFDGTTFIVQNDFGLDKELINLELQHYNQLIGVSGVGNMIACLAKDSESKKAYMSFWDNNNIFGVSGEIPCLAGIHAYIKSEKVFFVTQMRSNNAFKLLEIDMYFGMALQIYIANQLGKALGSYCHQVASLIIYSKDKDQFLKEYE